MTTLKLLLGTTWRGGVFGLIAGTLGGATYGAIFANAIFLFRLAQEWSTLGAENFIPGIAVVLILAFIGSIMGALFGVPTGFIVGLLNGLLVGIVTRVFFFPLRDAKTFRRVIAMVSALFTGIASWFCFFAIILFYSNRDKADVPMLALIVTLPALIAGVASALISRAIAGWYEKLDVGS
ncbi:MAG: hypothetical protein HZC40_06675 [Chloroflexi bacterium]|nr:hypothetical protein [Chloroflexota bacterium]